MAEYFGLFGGLFTVLCASYMLLCNVVEGPGKQVHVLWVPKQFHSKWNNNSKLSVLRCRFWPASGGNSIILHTWFEQAGNCRTGVPNASDH